MPSTSAPLGNTADPRTAKANPFGNVRPDEVVYRALETAPENDYEGGPNHRDDMFKRAKMLADIRIAHEAMMVDDARAHLKCNRDRTTEMRLKLDDQDREEWVGCKDDQERHDHDSENEMMIGNEFHFGPSKEDLEVQRQIQDQNIKLQAENQHNHDRIQEMEQKMLEMANQQQEAIRQIQLEQQEAIQSAKAQAQLAAAQAQAQLAAAAPAPGPMPDIVPEGVQDGLKKASGLKDMAMKLAGPALIATGLTGAGGLIASQLPKAQSLQDADTQYELIVE